MKKTSHFLMVMETRIGFGRRVSDPDEFMGIMFHPIDKRRLRKFMKSSDCKWCPEFVVYAETLPDEPISIHVDLPPGGEDGDRFLTFEISERSAAGLANALNAALSMRRLEPSIEYFDCDGEDDAEADEKN
jgi:hypothetical protein